jgi:phospholipid/cholesterol/gamma-HCH transport system substrate-binding protein
MREGTRDFMVGIVAAGGLAILATLLFFFGELERFTNPRYYLRLETTNASGLRGGGSVEYNGVPVGVVDHVSIENVPDHAVHVHLLIQEHVTLPTDVQVSVSSPLIGGSAMLRFTDPPREPGQQPPSTLPRDGKGVIIAPDLTGGMLEGLAAQLDERMKPLMASLEKFNKLADTYTAVGENMNALLQVQGEETLAGGEPPNLRTAVIKINAALDEATEGLRLAREWLDDEQLREDLRTGVTNANKLIDQATTAIDQYTRLAGTLERDADDLTKRLLPVADQLAGMLEDIRGLTAQAKNGEGTVGQMLTNPDLYNSLNDAAIRLERTLVELQLFLEKVKAEGLPMKLF